MSDVDTASLETKINPSLMHDSSNEYEICENPELFFDTLLAISPDNNVTEKMSFEKTEVKSMTDDINSGNYLSILLNDFFYHIQKIIEEDESRYEMLETCSAGKNSLFIEKNNKCLTKQDYEIVIDKVKQQIVDKFNKYYYHIRDLNNKILVLNKDKENFQSIVNTKNNEIADLQKIKQVNKKPDSKDKFKSLTVEPINKRNQLQMTQLNQEIKSLEVEIEELQEEKRDLKKELRNLKNQCKELAEENKDYKEKMQKLNVDYKKLKKEFKKTRNHDSSDMEETISDLKIEINKYKQKLSEKDQEIENEKEKIKLWKESLDNERNSLPKNESVICEKNNEIESLKAENQSLTDEIKSLKKNECDEKESLRDEVKSLNELICKKDMAISTMRQKHDKILNEKKQITIETDSLTQQLEQCEIEKKKKQDAIGVLQLKIKNSRTNEKELEKMKQIQQQLTLKEKEFDNLQTESVFIKNQLEEKVKECELLKKEKIGFQEEINNMKLLNFKK